MVVGAPCAWWRRRRLKMFVAGQAGSGRSAQRAGGRLRLVNHGGEATEGEASGPGALPGLLARVLWGLAVFVLQ